MIQLKYKFRNFFPELFNKLSVRKYLRKCYNLATSIKTTAKYTEKLNFVIYAGKIKEAILFTVGDRL